MSDEASSHACDADSSGSGAVMNDEKARLDRGASIGGRPDGIPVCLDLAGALAHLGRSGDPAWTLHRADPGGIDGWTGAQFQLQPSSPFAVGAVEAASDRRPGSPSTPISRGTRGTRADFPSN